VRIARALLEHLSQPRGELLIEIELLSASKNQQVDAGILLPNSFPVTNFSTIFNAQPPTVADGAALLGFGGGMTVFGVAIGAANLTASFSRTEARSLSSFQLRTADGMPGELHIGERYPIANATFSPITVTDEIQDSIDDGTYRAPFPSISFEDLGLVFKITPKIHSLGEVSMEIEAEFSVLAGGAVNGIPIISNRQFKSALRLEQGEAAVISGLYQIERRKNRTGVAFLSEIPILGDLLSDHTWRYSMSDVLVVIRPRIIRQPPAETSPSLTLRYGAEESPLSGL
jgi:type II secretory pathway component GspD/PulD (secretin)